MYDVCIFPVRWLISSGRASTYVPSSFFSPRCCSMSCTMGCLCCTCVSTSSEVTYCPVFVFLGFSTIFSLPKSMSPTCRGEAMLNGSPARVYIFSSISCMRLVKRVEVSRSDAVFILAPLRSMWASTGTSGISISWKSFSHPSLFSSASRMFFSFRVTSASSQAYSYICVPVRSRILRCPFPRGPMSVSIFIVS